MKSSQVLTDSTRARRRCCTEGRERESERGGEREGGGGKEGSLSSVQVYSQHSCIEDVLRGWREFTDLA